MREAAEDAEGTGSAVQQIPAFDHVVNLACRVLKVPTALLTLREACEERIAARTGARGTLRTLEALPLTPYFEGGGGQEAPHSLVVRDARRDARVRGDRALAEAGVVACMAFPLHSASGRPVGVLCAMDYLPRRWVRDETRVMAELAALADSEVQLHEWRRATEGLSESLTERDTALSRAELLRLLAEQPLSALFVLEEGTITFASPGLRILLGHTPHQEAPTMSAPLRLFDPNSATRIEQQLVDGDGASLSLCTSVAAGEDDGRVLRLEVRLDHVALGDRFAVVGSVVDCDEPARYAEALRADGDRYRRVFDDAPDGIAIAGPDGRILACNPQFVRVTGYPSVREAVGQSLLQLEAEPGEFAALVQRIRDERVVAPEEIDVVRRDGTPLRVVAQVTGSFDATGSPTELRVHLLDVTQRARAEEALRVSDERLRLVELATNDVLWEWNLATGELTWNGAGPRRFLYAPEEFRRSIEWQTERIHLEDRERVIRGLHAAINGVGDGWTGEYRFRRGDDSYASVLDRAYVVRNRRGEAVRVTGWMLDVTQWRLSEESHRFLSRASATLDSTLDVRRTLGNLARVCVPDLADYCMIDAVDEDGGIRRVSAAHAQVRRERHLGHDTHHPPDADPALHPVIAVVRTGEPLLLPDCGDDVRERLERGGNDAVRKLGLRSLMIVPLTAQERVVGAITLATSESGRRYHPVDLVVARDLAHRAALAIANSQLLDTAERALRAREEVLGVVSHDLRGPLNAITTTTGMLLETEPERREGNRRWLEIVQRAAEQMNSLINDLLDVSSIEAGHFTLERSVADVAAVTTSACEMLQPLAGAKQVSLGCRVTPGTGELWLDARQLQRVLANLVGNAIKFTPAGGVIELRVAGVEGAVRFEVADSGPGIPADQITRIFDRFWQGRMGDRRGAGLGLAIAKGIVEAHGGRIGVESREGNGSTFFFEVPRTTPGSALPTLPVATPQPHTSTDPPGPAAAAE